MHYHVVLAERKRSGMSLHGGGSSGEWADCMYKMAFRRTIIYLYVYWRTYIPHTKFIVHRLQGTDDRLRRGFLIPCPFHPHAVSSLFPYLPIPMPIIVTYSHFHPIPMTQFPFSVRVSRRNRCKTLQDQNDAISYIQTAKRLLKHFKWFKTFVDLKRLLPKNTLSASSFTKSQLGCHQTVCWISMLFRPFELGPPNSATMQSAFVVVTYRWELFWEWGLFPFAFRSLSILIPTTIDSMFVPFP